MHIGKDEIENRFGFHKATIEGENATLPKHRDVRLLFREFAERLAELLPDEQTARGIRTSSEIAFERLEDASMWSHKAIAETSPLVRE